MRLRTRVKYFTLVLNPMFLEALILFLLVFLLWATVLTYRERKAKRKNLILEKRIKHYIEKYERLKLMLNPTSNGKEDREKESEET